MSDWTIYNDVTCVACPKCAFTFDAAHTDPDGVSYSCPLCDPELPFTPGSTFTVPDLEGKMVKVPVPRGYQLINSEYYHRLSAGAVLLSDLDQCQHGRHRGDVCGGVNGCNGPSLGNRFLTEGDRIGTQIGGEPITVPVISPGERKDLRDATLWRGE